MGFSYILVKTKNKYNPNTFVHIWNWDKEHQKGIEISEKEQIVQLVAGDFFTVHRMKLKTLSNNFFPILDWSEKFQSIFMMTTLG